MSVISYMFSEAKANWKGHEDLKKGIMLGKKEPNVETEGMLVKEESGVVGSTTAKLLVIGYYNKNNLGDEAYKEVMGKFFPNYDLTFVGSRRLGEIEPKEYEAVVVGGGDIINDYFNDDIRPFLIEFRGPKIAFSIGIPFPSLIKEKYLGHFDHVFTRNYEDIRDIQELLGSTRSHFIPDIALSYKASRPHKSNRDKHDFKEKKSLDILTRGNYQRSEGCRETEGDRSGRVPAPEKTANKRCGVFLVGNMVEYPRIAEDIAHLVSKIALTYNVVLYCFNPGEDVEISSRVRFSALQRLNESYTDAPELKSLLEVAKKKGRIKVDANKYSAQEMIDIMTDLDFAVCMRYHSHVFCTVAGTPFMSISSTRKTSSYMKQAGLSRYQYRIPLNGYCTPMGSNYGEMRDICRNAIHNKSGISRQLKVFLNQSRFLLSNQKACRLIRITKTDVCSEIVNFINDTGDHENGARLLSNHLIGYPDSPYVWGMYESFKSAGAVADAIRDSARYILRHGASLVEDFVGLISGPKTIPLYIDIREYQSYKGAHRGGWYIACEELYKLNSKNSDGIPNGIICDMYVDRTFHWANSYMSYQGVIPYTGPWCGFVHHTSDTFYSKYNSYKLFEIPEFIQSLHTCLAIFVLSEPLAVYFRKRLSTTAPHVKVITFTHPVVDPTTRFSTNNYHANSNPMLINIGAWMRNPFTIYRLPNLPVQRAVLIGKEMSDHIPPINFRVSHSEKLPSQSIDIPRPNFTSSQYLSKDTLPSNSIIYPCRDRLSIPRWVIMVGEWLQSLGINPLYYEDGVLYISDAGRVDEINNMLAHFIDQVKVIDYKSNETYDDLLSNNIVFLDLIDAAAVNTIIECIVRHTPIILNRIPGTVSLLGEMYPLYYNNVDEVSDLLTPHNIKAAHKYLKRIDSDKYTIDFFINHIEDVARLL